jgi:hypothetical protein
MGVRELMPRLTNIFIHSVRLSEIEAGMLDSVAGGKGETMRALSVSWPWRRYLIDGRPNAASPAVEALLRWQWPNQVSLPSPTGRARDS